MRRMPPLSAVRVFEAAARHLNFTKAAAELAMTQAAVSYQVKQLEERLGVALFTRRRGAVQLTDIGAEIAPALSECFDTLDATFAFARRERAEALVVSCSNTFAAGWLARRLGSFQAQYPALKLKLQATDELVDFAAEDVDVAIRGGGGVWAGLTAHFLMRMLITPLASPSLVAANPPVQAPEDLLHWRRISPAESWWDVWFRAALGREPPASAGAAISLDSQLMDGRAAIAGQGCAILNPTLWLAELNAGTLVQVLPFSVPIGSAYWLVYPKRSASLPRVRAFRSWLFAELAAEAESDVFGAYIPEQPSRPARD